MQHSAAIRALASVFDQRHPARLNRLPKICLLALPTLDPFRQSPSDRMARPVQYVLNPDKRLTRRLELNKVKPVSLGASTHESLDWMAKRQSQERHWFRREIRSALVAMLERDPTVSAMIGEMENHVSNGAIDRHCAVDELSKAIRERGLLD